MVLFLNVFVSDQAFVRYHRGLYGEEEDKLAIFHYMLASLSVLPWRKVILYCELDTPYQHRKEELEKIVYSLYPTARLHHFRNQYQPQWKKAVDHLGTDAEGDLVWFCCNHDHIFVDYEIHYVKRIEEKLNQLRKEHPYVSCYYSHWPESVAYVDPHYRSQHHWQIQGGQHLEFADEGLVHFWRNTDSIQVLNPELLRYWWFETDYGNRWMSRTDPLRGESVVSPERIACLIPRREIVRHFDAYSHAGIDIDAAPPLNIPGGFFDRSMRLHYAGAKALEGFVEINPLRPHYRCVDPEGADWRCTLDRIPLFWKDRISEIRDDSNGNHKILQKFHDAAVLKAATQRGNLPLEKLWEFVAPARMQTDTIPPSFHSFLSRFPSFQRIALTEPSLTAFLFQRIHFSLWYLKRRLSLALKRRSSFLSNLSYRSKRRLRWIVTNAQTLRWVTQERVISKIWPHLIQKDHLCLDAGCGGGAYAMEFFLKRGAHVILFDYDEKHPRLALQQLRESGWGKQILVVRADAQALPFKSGAFDNIQSFEVLEHLRDPKKALQEFHRVAKNTASLAVSVPHPPEWTPNPEHQIEGYTTEALSRLLENEGWSVTSIRHCMLILSRIVLAIVLRAGIPLPLNPLLWIEPWIPERWSRRLLPYDVIAVSSKRE